MSYRSLFEINHDFWMKVDADPVAFNEALQRFLSSASNRTAEPLERFGLRWFGTRHHSDGFETNFGGRKTVEQESAKR